MEGGGRETSDARFSPTILMIIIIVLFYRQAYYTIIVQGRGCFEADKIIFLTSNSIWFAFSHIAFSLNSSCQTGLQSESNGEEISGLAYLFERAGSKAVIASLWNVEEVATKEIMVRFYQNIKNGMNKDKALRQAKLSQMSTEKHSHPFFWSPFVLIGDGR